MTPQIDAHVHVFAKASAEFPREVTDLLPADMEAPVEKLLGEMETNGVDQAVLVQIGGTSLEHHTYLRHCLQEYPGHFRGIGLIPEDVSSPEDHMDRLAVDGGIIGFRLFQIGGPADPLAPMDIRTFRTYPIWKYAAEKDYVLWLYVGAGEIHQVPFLIDAFPQVRVVFNHMLACPGKGAFSYDARHRPHVEIKQSSITRYTTAGLNRYENVYVHLSGQYAFSNEDWPYKDLKGWLAPGTFLRRFGARRLMWATDFPWIAEEPGYGPLTRLIAELEPDLPASDLAEIMGGTAKRVLRFLEVGTG